MTDWRNNQSEILSRTVRLCEENGIGCSLAEDSALAAHLGLGTGDYPVIAVDIGDAVRLVQAVSSDRLEIEGIHNNPRHSVYTMEIYDPDTIDFNAGTFFNYVNNCLHVTVRLVRHNNRNTLQRRLTSRQLVRYRSKYAPQDSAEESTQNRSYNGELSKKGSAAGIRLLKSLSRTYGGGKDAVNAGGRSYARNPFAIVKRLDAGGMKYPVPDRCEDYLAKTYGRDWADARPKEFREDADQFRDADHSWKEYRRRISGFDLADYRRMRDEYKPLNDRYKVLREKVSRYYDILDRTHTRFRMWEELEGSRDEIMRLAGEGKITELGELLDPYIEEMRRLHRKGLGLSFDPEIFDAACMVMESRGLEDEAAECRSLVPEEHKRRLTLMNYRGEAV